jgi:hypothetical protein
MDRFAANTLRTLGIVLTSIFVILGCLILLAIALCFGALASSGSPTDRSSASGVAVAAFVVAIVLVVIGVFIISRLAKGMVSAGSGPPQPYTLIPPPIPKPVAPATPLSDEAKLDQALASLEAKLRAPELPEQVASPENAEHAKKAEPLGDVTLVHSKRDVSPPRRLDIDHLSPASRTAIRQLAYAIVAKVAAEVALGIIGWFGALGVPRFVRVPFPVYRFGFLAWGLAAIAPHLVLLYALARRPGPRAFAYALVIPALHLLFGVFGHSAFLAFILRAGQTAAPLLSIAPWLLDILILYLAWKAIRQTGIEPNPARLIMASVVIFLYTSFLPLLVVILNRWGWM